MNVADEIVSKSNGARFYRADLHIHSVGGSHDVKDMAMSVTGGWPTFVFCKGGGEGRPSQGFLV